MGDACAGGRTRYGDDDGQLAEDFQRRSAAWIPFGGKSDGGADG